MSTPEAAALIQEARAQGVDIHGETCPQYLLFNEDTAERAGVFARMKPPLRDAGRMARLRELYREGALEITGSDHAPYLREEKLRNGQDIWRTFDGVPGLELSLPLLVTAAERGELTYESIARNTAENTARLFGLPGVAASLAAFGVTALVAVPVLFVVSADAFRQSLGRLSGERPTSWAQRAQALSPCAGVLVLAVALQQTLMPALLAAVCTRLFIS